MSLQTQQQLENTKKKLSELERLYSQRKNQLSENKSVHQQTLLSLKRLINQLKEEIACFQVHKTSA